MNTKKTRPRHTPPRQKAKRKVAMIWATEMVMLRTAHEYRSYLHGRRQSGVPADTSPMRQWRCTPPAWGEAIEQVKVDAKIDELQPRRSHDQ